MPWVDKHERLPRRYGRPCDGSEEDSLARRLLTFRRILEWEHLAGVNIARAQLLEWDKRGYRAIGSDVAAYLNANGCGFARGDCMDDAQVQRSRHAMAQLKRESAAEPVPWRMEILSEFPNVQILFGLFTKGTYA